MHFSFQFSACSQSLQIFLGIFLILIILRLLLPKNHSNVDTKPTEMNTKCAINYSLYNMKTTTIVDDKRNDGESCQWNPIFITLWGWNICCREEKKKRRKVDVEKIAMRKKTQRKRDEKRNWKRRRQTKDNLPNINFYLIVDKRLSRNRRSSSVVANLSL